MKVGFVGLGTMGAPMARRLLDAGHEVTVHNRTRERERPLADAGAARAATPREAAEGAELVVTIVGDSPDVREVVLGPDGVAEGLGEGAIVIDMSTISPDVTREIAEALRRRGVHMLDAPCSGGSTLGGGAKLKELAEVGFLLVSHLFGNGLAALPVGARIIEPAVQAALEVATTSGAERVAIDTGSVVDVGTTCVTGRHCPILPRRHGPRQYDLAPRVTLEYGGRNV